MTDVAVTEFEEIDPDELHLVGKGANGFKALLAKSASEEVREVLETIADATDTEIVKADDDRPDCTTCDGNGKIMDGNRKCPDCKGSGVKPMPGDTEKSLAQLAAIKEAGVAASGADVPVDPECPACKGSGKDETGMCDACAGTGTNAAAPAASELNAVDADAGKITEGAGGRETVDKSEDEDLEKKNVDPNVGGGVDRDKLDASDFAGKDRSFPIVKPGDVSDAASSIGRAGPDNYSADKLKANIMAIAKRKGASFVAELPKAWTAEKADGTFSAPNPALAAAATQVTADTGSDSTDDGSGPMTPPATPGSPAWEAVDAQTATDAALALMTAVELMRTFAQRESTEVAMGEGNDIFDAYAATGAICAAQEALGIIAQLAFHEGLEAAKSLEDDEIVEKAGRRLAGKTVAALAAARDKASDLAQHIGGVLGDDDPAKKKTDATTKSIEIDPAILAKEIDDMTADELLQLLDERDAQKAAAKKEADDAEKAAGGVDGKGTSAAERELVSVAGGKAANAKAKKKNPKAENTDLADEADQGDNDSASSPAMGAAKAEETETEEVEVELTPEQIEARIAAKTAKKAAKDAKRAEKELATKIALTKSIEESLTKVVEQNEVLKSTVETLTTELEGVKKMAAPNPIVRTAPVEAQNVAKARDEVELRIATLEREARETSDPTVRSGNRELVKELREQLLTPKN